MDRNRSGFTLNGRTSSPPVNLPRGGGVRGNASVHSEHLWNMLEDG
jgi:hypothetical protein